jgi:hypothetical protein
MRRFHPHVLAFSVFILFLQQIPPQSQLSSHATTTAATENIRPNKPTHVSGLDRW